jgi:hypothetical protein
MENEELTDAEQQREAIIASVFTGIAIVIMVIPSYFLFIKEDWLQIQGMYESGISGLVVMRTIMLAICLIWGLPLAILVEVTGKWYWRRGFKLVNVAIVLLLWGEFFVIMAGMLTVFDRLSPRLPWDFGILLSSISGATALFITMATGRIRQVQKHIKSTF